MSRLVIALMKNEGPFIVEWLVWYRMLGFQRALVLTNDCTDHSPPLLQAFAAADWVTTEDIAVPEGVPPFRPKLTAAKKHPLTRKADWVLLCDVDEFLVIHRGAGLLDDLLDLPGPGFIGMALNWKTFGSAGRLGWEDGLVHRQFSRSAPPQHPDDLWIKSLFRRPGLFNSYGPHSPYGIPPDRLKRPWGSGGLRWVDSLGQTLEGYRPEGPQMQQLPVDRICHEGAQLNHYMVRARDSFELKQGSPSPSQLVNRYSENYWRKRDRNEVEDLSALRYRSAFDALHAEAMALPGVRRLHHLCCADYVARLGAKLGFDAEADPRWRHHMAEASTADGLQINSRQG